MTTHATTTQAWTQEQLDATLVKQIESVASTMNSFLIALGDRYGLFRELAKGAATPGDLAKRCRVDERHVREWASALAAGSLLVYEPRTGKYALPPVYVPFLADDSHPYFLGGGYQELVGLLKRWDRQAEVFAQGGGIAYDEFDDDVHVGLERFTSCWFHHMLVPVWIESLPQVKAKLEAGAVLADVGCGGGRSLVALANAFPKSRFVGIEPHPPSAQRARESAKRAGVADRVRVIEADPSKERLPEKYDIVTTFDVVHDSVDPRGLVKGIRDALKPDGAYVCLEIRSEDDPAKNVGPIPNLLYGFSNFLCLGTSLAHGGAGLGSLGLPPARFRALCQDVGFREIDLVESHTPFNHLYVARP